MVDFIEITAENDEEKFATELFLAEILDVSPTGALLQWACVNGKSYKVYRADAVAGPFVEVSPEALNAASTGYMKWTHAGATGKGFYRVKQL